MKSIKIKVINSNLLDFNIDILFNVVNADNEIFTIIFRKSKKKSKKTLKK